MPVFNNILAGASGQAGGAAAGYEIERSVRFNSSDSAYLSKNISGSDSTFTISCWIKLGNIDSSATLQALFSVGTATYGDTLFILSDGRVSLYNGSSTGHTYAAGRLRDPSAWYHVHVKVTSGVPVLYINSEQFNVTTGYTWDLGGSNCFIGAFNNGGSPAFYWNGLIADFHCVSNQALDPTDFGEFDDNGVWQPIEYAGTYGTNGFHLPFSDNSSDSALGTDTSGNGNDWTVNNISAGQNSVSTDVITSVSSGGRAYNDLANFDKTMTNASQLFSRAMFVSADGCYAGPPWTYTFPAPLLWSDMYLCARESSTITMSTDAGTINMEQLNPGGAYLWPGAVSSGYNALYFVASGQSPFSVIYSVTYTRSGGNPTAKGFQQLDPRVHGTSLLAETDGSATAYYANVTLNSNQDLNSLSVGDSVIQSDSGATGSITSVNSGTSTVNLTNTTGTWAANGSNTIVKNNTYSALTDNFVDSPTNGDTADDTGAGGEVPGNYCTWNPLNNPGGSILSNGNLDCTTDASSQGRVVGTLAVSSGKYYWECTPVGIINFTLAFGIAGSNEYTSLMVGSSVSSYSYSGTGDKRNNSVNSAYGASWGSGDTIGIALDLDSGTLAFYKNGASQGTAFTGISGSFVPAASDNTGGGGSSFVANFGQRPFAYSAPSGFKALCTANLDTPTIEDGSTAMDVALYTGNGSTQSISGLEFSPDLVLIKSRESALTHPVWYDSVRGAFKMLRSNSTAVEVDYTSVDVGVTNFGANSFTIKDNTPGDFNINGAPGGTYAGASASYVAWTWDAGSSTVSNTDGDITSSVRANPSAGFSIVKWTAPAWTGSAANRQVGHGLGAAPAFIITKSLDNAASWYCYHKDLDATSPEDWYITLNNTSARGTLADSWGPNKPDSTTFGDRLLGWFDGDNVIAYCFAPVEGYSAFGSYTGNGSATDSPFIWTGFRPAVVIIKITSTSSNWVIFDSKRSGYNAENNSLSPNQPQIEDYYVATPSLDLLSNGFKPRTTSGYINSTGHTYIYVAFAENPFKYARAR